MQALRWRAMLGLISLPIVMYFGAQGLLRFGPPRAIDGDPVSSMRELAAKGRGVPWERLGLRMRGPACDGNEFTACYHLSRFALRGRCEPRDDVRARSLLRKACVYGGVTSACTELERLVPS